MKYTNDELINMIKHGTEEVEKFRIFLDSYNGNDKDILIKKYKEANLALDILRAFFDGASTEGAFYYMNKIRKLEPFLDDLENSEK